MYVALFRAYSISKRRKFPPINRVVCHRKIALKKCFFFAIKLMESQRLPNTAVNVDLLKPETILSEKNRKSFVEKFKKYKVTKKLDQDTKQAAVLVPLCMHKGELGLLYTLRSTKLSSNRGQVSFPGGMYDEEDGNLEETALRETWEELKIPRDKIDIWGSGNIINKITVDVMPVFGYIGEVEPEKLEINPDEVEEAFVLSLKDHCDPSMFGYTHFRAGYTLPVYLAGKHRIWGFTAAIAHMALSALLPGIYNHKLATFPLVSSKNSSSDRLNSRL